MKKENANKSERVDASLRYLAQRNQSKQNIMQAPTLDSFPT